MTQEDLQEAFDLLEEENAELRSEVSRLRGIASERDALADKIESLKWEQQIGRTHRIRETHALLVKAYESRDLAVPGDLLGESPHKMDDFDRG